MSFGPTEQWLVRRVVRQEIGQRMAIQEIHAGRMEPAKEGHVVGLEHGVGADPPGIGAPGPKHIDQIPAFRPRVENQGEWADGFEIEPVAIAEEQKE